MSASFSLINSMDGIQSFWYSWQKVRGSLHFLFFPFTCFHRFADLSCAWACELYLVEHWTKCSAAILLQSMGHGKNAARSFTNNVLCQQCHFQCWTKMKHENAMFYAKRNFMKNVHMDKSMQNVLCLMALQSGI